MKAHTFTKDYTEADFTLRAGDLPTLVIEHGLDQFWPLITIYGSDLSNMTSGLIGFLYNVNSNIVELRFQTMPTIDVWHIRVVA